MNFAETLSRNDMKNIMAGYASIVGGKSHKCCWEGTNNCSGCTPAPSGPCVDGAEKIECDLVPE